MSLHIGFVPPRSRGPGLSALFFSLADQLSEFTGPLSCEIPPWVTPPECPPPLLRLNPSAVSPDLPRFSLTEDMASNPFSALVLTTRPMRSDLVGLRAQLGRHIDSSRSVPVRILLWGGEEFVPYDFGSFFSQLIHPVFFSTRALVKADNGRRLLREVNPRLGGLSSLRKLAEGIFKDGQSERLQVPSQVIDLAQFQSRVRENFWRTVEGSSLPENDELELERILDRVMEISFLENPTSAPPMGSLKTVRRALLQEIRGLGPLEDLMEDPEVTEIMVNGPSLVFVERQGRIELSSSRFTDAGQLRSVIDRMVGKMGRRVDTASPMCDLRLPNGARVNVVLPPLAPDSPIVTIRRFRADARSMDDLVKFGSVTRPQAGRLAEAARNRSNILIAGNSGSGKTTLLNALSEFIEPGERIITLEDAAELRLAQSHVVRLETRPKNMEGAGEVTMAHLVVNALRMRPDRLIIGECRGGEVIPMLQAMNTGHDGSMTTLHANSASDALQRLESMVLLGAPEWPIEAVRQQIAAGIDMVIYLKRTGAERRLIEMGRFVWDVDQLKFVAEDFT